MNKENYLAISQALAPRGIRLVAVSKTKSAEEILELYELGQRDFGENYVQELVDKQMKLPKDIRWHFIGHLQTNKVKAIAAFVHMIQSVDSLKLLQEINKQATKVGRVIHCLLQIHIAREETKFGLDADELKVLTDQFKLTPMPQLSLDGLMGMASFTEDAEALKLEFSRLRDMYEQLRQDSSAPWRFSTLSMGMSSDYQLAIEEGSNLVRIGSLIFGERAKKVPEQ